MSKRGKLALFMSGLFFGGVVDHLIYLAIGSDTSEYGLRVGAGGQLGFAALDFTIAGLLYWLHLRWIENRNA